MIAGLLIAASLQTVVGCQAINTDRIYGRDLGAADNAFRALPPTLEISPAPVPGQQRVFRLEELVRIARANHIESEFSKPICFAWEMTIPTRNDLLAAMSKTLANRNANIEIVDQSTNQLPKGELAFPLSGISGSSNGPVVWRGALNYGNGRTLLTWARVRITVKEHHVTTLEPLYAGAEIRPEQLKLIDYEGPLTREHHFASTSELAGLTPRSTIAAGSILTDNLVRERKQVERGDLVQVTVRSERTRLEAQGVAEDSGARGSTISVRNVKSGRTFRARVEDKGRVLVVPEGPTGLVAEEDSKSR